MATLKELLGDNFTENMSYSDIDKALSGMNLADLSKGDYVSKGKLMDYEKRLKTAEKNLADRLTDEEKQQAMLQEREAETKRILRENKYLKYKAEWGGTITDPSQLEKLANFYADGDYEKLSNAQKDWYLASIKSAEERVRTELAGRDSEPSARPVEKQYNVNNMSMEDWNTLKEQNPQLYQTLLNKIK